MKKSAPHAYCSLLALVVPLHLLLQHGIPAARCWVCHPSYRLNSGWGLSLWGMRSMQRERLVFYSYFFCEDAFLWERCSCGFYKWVSERNACWLSRGPMLHSNQARGCVVFYPPPQGDIVVTQVVRPSVRASTFIAVSAITQTVRHIDLKFGSHMYHLKRKNPIDFGRGRIQDGRLERPSWKKCFNVGGFPISDGYIS